MKPTTRAIHLQRLLLTAAALLATFAFAEQAPAQTRPPGDLPGLDGKVQSNPIADLFGAGPAVQAYNDAVREREKLVSEAMQDVDLNAGGQALTPEQIRANQVHFLSLNRQAETRTGTIEAQWQSRLQGFQNTQRTLAQQYAASPSPKLAEDLAAVNRAIGAIQSVVQTAAARKTAHRNSADNLLHALDTDEWHKLMAEREAKKKAAEEAAKKDPPPPDDGAAVLAGVIEKAKLDGMADRLDDMDEKLKENLAEQMRARLNKQINELRSAKLDPEAKKSLLRQFNDRLINSTERRFDQERDKRIDANVAELQGMIADLQKLGPNPAAEALIKQLTDSMSFLDGQKSGPPAGSSADIVNRFADKERQHDDERAAAEDDDHIRIASGGRKHRHDDMNKWLKDALDEELQRIKKENQKPPKPPPKPGTPPTSGTGTDLTPITVNARTITITFWDHGTEDGDMINIRLNGAIIPGGKDITLTTAPRSLKVELEGATSKFEVEALNEGSISPNTATVEFSNVTQGNAVQAYQIQNGQKTSMNITVTKS